MSRAEPSEHTIAANQEVANTLPFHNKQDFVDALRGKIKELFPRKVYKDGSGELIWDLTQYDFQQQLDDNTFPACPDSCNPSLWRVALLNAVSGVFEVVPGKVFQVRCYDIANMSAIKSDNGWIIIDPMTATETAREALKNLNAAYKERYPNVTQQEGDPPIRAVFFTHSHTDHFAGVYGLVPDPNVDTLPFPVYAPPDFLHEAVSENVVAGTAMIRRALIQCGKLLPVGERDHVDVGIGKQTGGGSGGIYAAEEIQFDGDLKTMNVDGVVVVLLNAPNTEAPSEMMIYFPQWRSFCSGEDMTHTFHNLLTPRGAKVRDPLTWSKCLNKVLRYFPNIESMFASHNWPTWINHFENGPFESGRITSMIKKQRDLYKYVHDQSMRLANNGYTMQEISEALQLPPSLANEWCNRGLYGTVVHNSKAVYQRYIGWFDANPASMHQLPPARAAEEYLRYMGSLANILSIATQDYNDGKYRAVAMVLNNVVYGTHRAHDQGTLSAADEQLRTSAINLLANTYDQMGYQAESGAWRGFYLTGASELRNGGPQGQGTYPIFNLRTVRAMSLELICDYLSVLLNPENVSDAQYTFNVTITPTFNPSGKGNSNFNIPGSSYMKWYVENSVFNSDTVLSHSGADEKTAAIVMSRSTLDELVVGTPGNQLIDEGKIHILPGTGGEAQVRLFFAALQLPTFWFTTTFPNYF
ncbi:Alkyl/aryl-sulfatase BDS1 [Trichoplax sp. H2]|nr:Alkyl/aryl-sulfatase BDS1 [Trichoplax sp. H2]|eukprot:RDD40823.1 Alkyl/aryl-sulfatase BDS1 [Trichoplax sp. H2]